MFWDSVTARLMFSEGQRDGGVLNKRTTKSGAGFEFQKLSDAFEFSVTSYVSAHDCVVTREVKRR